MEISKNILRSVLNCVQHLYSEAVPARNSNIDNLQTLSLEMGNILFVLVFSTESPVLEAYTKHRVKSLLLM